MSREDIATQAQKLVPLTPIPKAVPETPTFTLPTELPKVIDSSVLGATTKAQVPTAPLSTPPATTNVADQILQQTQVEDTAAQKQATGISQSILDILPKLQGQTATLAEEQQKAGVGTLKQDLQTLNSQILQKQAEIGLSDTQLVANIRAEETRDTLLPFAQSSQAKLAGDAAILRALKTSEIGVLNARAIAKQGDIQLAIETAQQAVDVKYAPYKEAISLYQAQLEALSPILSKDEEKQATAQQLKMDLALKDLEEKKAEAKTNLSLIFSSGLTNKFVNQNGKFIRSSDGKSYSDPAEFLKDAGVSSFEEAYQKGLVGDLTTEKLADIDFATQARNNYPDANIGINDSPETIAQKIKGSAKWKRETYIAPQTGPGPQKGSLAATDIVDASTDAQVRALIASKPGDGGYGAAYKAVSDRYGKAVADAYDKVYQGVFNGGQSVDAAFNNAKLGSNGIDSAGGLGDYDILAEAVSNKIGSVASKNSFLTQYKKATTDEQKIKILASNVVLPTEVKNGIIQNTQVTKSLEDVLSMLDRGVKTGLLQAAQSYVANKTGTGGDKEIEAIKSKLVTAVQPYRNKVTGAAWGDQEEAEYQALIGSVKFTPDDLRNKLNVFKDTLKQQSQTALLAGIDPLGAVNSNSSIQGNSNLGGTSLSAQVAAKGYDYQKMRDDGNSDDEIKAALGL